MPKLSPTSYFFLHIITNHFMHRRTRNIKKMNVFCIFHRTSDDSAHGAARRNRVHTTPGHLVEEQHRTMWPGLFT